MVTVNAQGVGSRAERLAGRRRPRRARRTDRRRGGEPPLRDRLHRVERAGPRRGRRGLAVPDRLSLRGAGGRPGRDRGFTREIMTGDLLEALAKELPSGRIGFDDATTTVREHARLLEHAAAGAELVPAGGLVERLRLVKDADEIARIGAAADLVDGIYAWLLERGLAGRREWDVAVELEHEMRRRGASEPSFASIVASGPRGALPHASPGDDPIEPGTLVTIDIGARLDGYCSDCTRTFAVGAEPSGLGREIYELVLAAQLAGLGAVAAGQHRPRRRRGCPSGDRGRRLRRAVRARPGPRRRHRDPRGAAALASAAATPSSRRDTGRHRRAGGLSAGPAWACGSRTSSSSRSMAPMSSATSPRTSL